MKFYFTDRQVPELAKLGDSQRRVVLREAYKNYTSGQRSWESNIRFGYLLTVLCAGATGSFAYRAGSECAEAMGSFDYRVWIGWLLAIVTAGVAVGTVGFGSQSLRRKRLRPYFRRYLLEHGNEIERIGEDVAVQAPTHAESK